ncbi:MAG TPA: hypothetical protein VMU11_03255 [Verrucomicrobiae bacterium]|nr:hypothetical protein [Verrucomicrobiae bacterium]
MENLPLSAESRRESGNERAREDVRRMLAKRADALLAGSGFTTARHAGEPFALHAETLPRASASEAIEPKPVTFDGFDRVGLPVEEARESLEDLMNQMASSVRFSFQPAVKIMDGKFIVAQYHEKPVGHVRVDIMPLDGEDMPDKEEIKTLLKRQAFRVSRWAGLGLSAEDVALILSASRRTRREWIENAAASLATHGDPEDALRKAATIVDDVLQMRSRL